MKISESALAAKGTLIPDEDVALRRIADLIKRSGVEDSDILISVLEQFAAREGGNAKKTRRRCNAVLNDPCVGVPCDTKTRRRYRCWKPACQGSALCSDHDYAIGNTLNKNSFLIYSAIGQGVYGGYNLG